MISFLAADSPSSSIGRAFSWRNILLTGLLFSSFATGQETDPARGDAPALADGFFPGPIREPVQPDSVRESGCGVEDTPCQVRYALRLPEGFYREPNCVEHTVCVSETLSIRHDDFLAIMELVSPQIQPDWVNVSMQDVMMGVVLVTAESDRGHGRGFDFINGATFLVEQEPPIVGSWSILRGQVYNKDLRPGGVGREP